MNYIINEVLSIIEVKSETLSILLLLYLKFKQNLFIYNHKIFRSIYLRYNLHQGSASHVPALVHLVQYQS